MLKSPIHHLPEDEFILSCMISAGHFCILNTVLHLLDHAQDCSFYLFKNGMAAMRILQDFCNQ